MAWSELELRIPDPVQQVEDICFEYDYQPSEKVRQELIALMEIHGERYVEECVEQIVEGY